MARGRLYGLEVLKILSSEAKLTLAEGTVYPILSRLKQEGLVASEWVEAEAGHPRKYYWLTKNGRTRAEAMANAWMEFSGNVTQAVKPLLNGKE